MGEIRLFSRRDALAAAAGAVVGARLPVPALARQPARPVALAGGTLIDGTGRPPWQNSTLIIHRGVVEQIVGPADLALRGDVSVLDMRGRWIVPGFIDTNVHFAMAPYDDQEAVALEHAQLCLKYGITTVRDSYGFLTVLKALRDELRRGGTIGPRILVAGNIIGWGGVHSSHWDTGDDADLAQTLSPAQRRNNWEMTQGVGAELVGMPLEQLREAIRRYLQKGPDFVKYAATGHWLRQELIFSAQQQWAIVEEAHMHRVRVDVHAQGFAAKQTAVEAGVDFIQHITSETAPDAGPFPERCLDRVVGSACLGSVNSEVHAAQITAENFEHYYGRPLARPELLIEVERRKADERIRFQQLLATDVKLCFANDTGRAPGWMYRGNGAGNASLRCIEGLVSMGMTPMQALVAATRNGAEACGQLDRLGTLENGKIADLVVLDADPLENIANVHRIHAVMKGGRFIDRDALPERPTSTRST